jgi:transcriptional regulator with XRE-family HTH domain
LLNTGGFCSGGIEKYMRNRDSTYILLTRDFISTMKEVYLYHRMNGGMYMNQSVTGKFIALKRKQKNLTQEQLAEKLGVSNKTISKWETGKCMPDYSIVKSLCEELEVTVAELLDGEKAEDKSVRIYDDEQMLDLLRRTQELEKQKVMLTGLILIVMGIAFQALSYTLGGSDFKDFLSGLLLGLSIAEMLVGVYVVGKSLTGR